MDGEGPPELVTSNSCRNDKKLVAFIIEQRMRLIEVVMPMVIFFSNVKENFRALWLYNNYESNIPPNASRPLTTAYRKRRHLERLNMLIAYSTPGSQLNVGGYLKRAHISFFNKEDFYCLYNIYHAKKANLIFVESSASVPRLYNSALVRGSGFVNPYPLKERLVVSCFSLVECRDSTNYGRHLNARQNLARGDTALREMPFVSLLIQDFWMRCHHCLIYAPLVLIPCQSCSLALFCSETCRKRAHDEYHSMECTIMPILLGQYSSMEILALRLTIRIFNILDGMMDELELYIRSLANNMVVAEYNTPYGCQPNAKVDYGKVYRLTTNRSKLCKKKITDNGLKAVSLARMLVREHGLPNSFVELLAELTVRHLHILRSNALVLHCSVDEPSKNEYSSSSVPYALVLVTTGSMFNHSCDANVEYCLSPDGAIMFVANRSIPRGTQMHINYRIDPTDTRYAFECYCQKCTTKRILDQPSTLMEVPERL
ncbi:SET and MYND domain-containing protein 4-like [Anopheles stephensi]|uniref:SET and MYND domain-containing protein 4-like n=1 Tax=Anopheles stephensi TaxID=30069 RepID=UPI001658B3DC|nr:SET and MYND domain-containing protein 4-like [Anopheles stephensi]